MRALRPIFQTFGNFHSKRAVSIPNSECVWNEKESIPFSSYYVLCALAACGKSRAGLLLEI
jgi:hypothetical protein